MDQSQSTGIQYHYAAQTGELVEELDPSGVQPVVAMPGIIDNRQVIYTTSDGDGQLQVYHADGSPAIQELEGQDTIVFLDEGMEVETETEVATASEAIEAVKYIEEGGEQMQKIIIQMAPQDQEIRHEPQRIIIPGLENYVVQMSEQDHQPENVRRFQNIQPKSIYPKLAVKTVEKPMRAQPLILKPPQIAPQTLSQPMKPEANVVSKSEITLPAKVVIDSQQVKHIKKYSQPKNENTEYIYVTRTLPSLKDDPQDVGKSVYNSIKISRPPVKPKLTPDPEATVPGIAQTEGSSSQQAASPESNQETATVVPPKQVTSKAQQHAALSQQVAVASQQVAAGTQQVAAASQQVATTLPQVATTPQQVTSKVVTATSKPVITATKPKVSASSQVVATSQMISPTATVQDSENNPRPSSQQLKSLIKSENIGQRMVSVLRASRNIVRKDGIVFPVDPVSKKIIFTPLTADEIEKAVSLDESSKDVNSGDEASDVSDGEQEPDKKKARPSYESLERVKSGKRKGKWKKKPKYKFPKSKHYFCPKDVAPPPKKTTKSKKQDKSNLKSNDTVSFDPNIQIKKEAGVGEDATLRTQKKKDEEELEEELEEKKCRMCLALHNAECPLMRRRITMNINDNNGCLNSSMLSLKSLPNELLLSSRDGHGLSVFASDVIKKGTHFGPLVGERMTFEQISHKMNFSHLWLIETEETISAVDKKITKYNFIHTDNEMTSNWCRYLRPTLNAQECNLIGYCKNEEILFVAREDIQEGEELILYFRFIEDLHNEVWFADLCNRTEKLCKRCDMVYTNLVSYVKHVQVFHPYSLKKLKAICKECGLVLESTGELTKHCNEVHQGNGAFVCKDCGKQFPIPRGLQQHRKFFHIVEGNFPCEHCGKCFCNRFKLRNHTRNKHSGKEFRCEVCKKVVGSRNALNRHRKSHTQEGYKFTCDRCGKSCRDNSNLRSHMLTHIKTKEYPCTVAGCPMRYGSKLALQMHFAKTHFLTPEQIKVHLLSIVNPKQQGGDEKKLRIGTEGVMSGTQTEIIYDMESESDQDDYTEYY